MTRCQAQPPIRRLKSAKCDLHKGGWIKIEDPDELEECSLLAAKENPASTKTGGGSRPDTFPKDLEIGDYEGIQNLCETDPDWRNEICPLFFNDWADVPLVDGLTLCQALRSGKENSCSIFSKVIEPTPNNDENSESQE